SPSGARLSSGTDAGVGSPVVANESGGTGLSGAKMFEGWPLDSLGEFSFDGEAESGDSGSASRKCSRQGFQGRDENDEGRRKDRGLRATKHLPRFAGCLGEVKRDANGKSFVDFCEVCGTAPAREVEPFVWLCVECEEEQYAFDREMDRDDCGDGDPPAEE